jgi:DNA processing protein
MPSTDPALADWLRLCLISGIGDGTIRKLLGAFGVPEQVFAASHAALAQAVGEAQAARVRSAGGDSVISGAVENALRWVETPGNHIVTLADAGYPRDLLDAADPPPLLYMKGRVELLGRRALAIVGSRNATAQGIANADHFAATLSRVGLCIVSGQALGIDTAAHRGGLTGPGSTIAVIGTGADIVYPARNRELAHAIAANGLIVSEFPLGTPANAANFPRRNRIISGLSKGVLVIEAALRSGSLITARLAGEQGRDVFALPGSIHSPLAKGCHQLIKQGAKLVDSVEDILEELNLAQPAGTACTEAIGEIPELPLPQAALLAVLGHDAVSVDALAERTGLATHVLSGQLLELELAGHVAQLPGGMVQRITR